ncbi:MAG: ribbon-helix-helix protein, CopG family [Candidatus Neomicrothrix subdominans]
MKTLAIRLEDEQHARLSILAKLSNQSVTDVIRVAIDERLVHLAADPEVSAKAEALTAQIEQDAREQRAAIAELFGSKTTASSRSRKS